MNWYADEYIVSKACMRCVDTSSSLCISDCNTHKYFRFSERAGWRKGCSSELRDGGNETSEPGSAWQKYKLVVTNEGSTNEKKCREKKPAFGEGDHG